MECRAGVQLGIPHLKLLVLPGLLWIIGFVLNNLVIAANQGHMPVLAPEGCDVMAAEVMAKHDWVHSCMTKESRLRFLADWIHLPDGIISPGDVMMYTGEATWQVGLLCWAVLMVKERR